MSMFGSAGMDSHSPIPAAFAEGLRGSFKVVAKLLSPLQDPHALGLLAGVSSNQLASASSYQLV